MRIEVGSANPHLHAADGRSRGIAHQTDEICGRHDARLRLEDARGPAADDERHRGDEPSRDTGHESFSALQLRAPLG